MRIICILLLLIVVNGQYSEKDCQPVFMHLNQGMKANEILNMYSEDGVFLIDKISSLLDNAYVQMGSAAGRVLYKTYLKNYVEECHLFYWQGQQKKAEVQEVKQTKLEAEEEERKAERKQHNARVDGVMSIMCWFLLTIVIGFLLACFCCGISGLYEELSKNYIFFQRRKKN